MIKEEQDKITFEIIGCAMEVHSILGCGFQEVIYQRALAKEMILKGLNFQREPEMSIYYKDEMIGTRRVDFLVENIVSVELKAIKILEDVHLAQAVNYLEAFNLQTGLLINFGELKLKYKRLFNNKNKLSEPRLKRCKRF